LGLTVKESCRLQHIKISHRKEEYNLNDVLCLPGEMRVNAVQDDFTGVTCGDYQ
jgi:hypothetical protein